ncbi:UvrD-helicase domain-containing protein [Altericista sp. CCNU0014]|uniref:UvrD-helicase domain-containing protein n=1 Tax=Altericista sp. CCNU0014 TaxID=3082949 RepID=UPI00384B6A30
MDRIEIARQIAADLHAQAVARGENPLHSYAFAVAEATRREIDVEKTAPGAAMLNGGRATFIPDAVLILYENIGTPFERAFLVAHEISHVELGDAPDAEPILNIDPARSSEPSPVGIDRVVDYSPRQRREVQMDLFAREFLLPRPVVRKLHVEEGLTVSQIAERFGAPFEVVAQQLLDALLLPPIALQPDAEKVEYSLNTLQAIEKNAAIRNHFESQYDHVLVDEYQDVNRSSVRLLQALCGDGENLWVVGDAKQSIYRFRGQLIPLL